MNRFIIEIIGKGLLIVLFSVFLSTIIYQLDFDHYDFYEIPEVVNRKNNFNESTRPVNTIFIGSSRIFRHINPVVFDSITGMQSYNLGYAGLFPFRSYDFLERLHLENKQIKYIFIELAPLAILGRNFNTEPFISSIDAHKYSIAMRFSNNSIYTSRERAKYTFGYTMLFCYKYMGMGVSKYLYQEIFKTPDLRENKDGDNTYTQGYLSLDDDLKLQGEDYKNLLSRRSAFAKQPKKWLELYKSANAEYLNNPVILERDVFTNYIEEIASELELQGIEVHFVISPRQIKSDLFYLRNQKRWLSDYIVHDFSDLTKYPDLFTEETSFDRVHLNEAGAEKLTKILAAEVN